VQRERGGCVGAIEGREAMTADDANVQYSIGVMLATWKWDSKYVRVNNEAMQTKKCQTSEGAKEQDHMTAGKRRLPKRRHATSEGVDGSRK